ncbi:MULTISPECIES: thiamine-phosphate kinase [Hallerella]|uniref:thiamine-phosphate kinase n=1 Tax=Hallerella TaxID=2815788 RepID=UPI0023F32D27|nr:MULTISPECIES: thiamine-phosphate kinase [Hallerella]MCI6874459.1 thiamine-phosphate kinase [Hallerella sp.]MDD6091849.1 thiamine-phosphate kinase [Hallerella succinigenes]MDY5028544.1 thiamine-phosphate kinase [Hallerella succinigenes]
MTHSSLHFPPLGEFDFVQKVLSDALPMDENAPNSRFWFGAGDDCAAFDGWLVTKDMSAENSHFRLDWSTPEQAVEKCIVSNVSDISSMGGEPKIALLGICVNQSWDKLIRERVAKAFADGFRKRGIALIGGDVVAAKEGLFSVTLLGRAEGEPLKRSGAKVGDTVYVSSFLGASGAGLWAFLHGKQSDPDLVDVVREHLSPKIDERMGMKLVQAGVSGGCIDLSDGMSSELNHLALSSGVRIRIDEKSVPIHPGALRLSEKYGVDVREFWLKGGEDYRLLFTSDLSKSIFLKNNLSVYPVGEVLEGSGVEIRNLAGKVETLKADCWSHL